MAVNESRYMGTEFEEGIVDGLIKRDAPNRGGVVENPGYNRSVLSHLYDYTVTDAKKFVRRLRGL